MDELLKYRLFFASIISLGSAAMNKLLDVYENEKELYEIKIENIENLPLTQNQKNEFVRFKKRFDLNQAIDNLNKMDMHFVTMNMKGYPSSLNEIAGKPYQLFYYGELPADNYFSVAIIGARNCSEYGVKAARYFSEELSSKGIQIISGMASGIDGVSQRASLEAGGRSFGILGSGIDICYPESNRSLYEELKLKGGVISEFPPGTKPIASNFPLRNRLISGMADIVLVVEAKEKSGTAITVKMALEQGKDVYAVPGRITDNLSKGCNKMISEGAGIASCSDDILDELERLGKTGRKRLDTKQIIDGGHELWSASLGGIKKRIYELLKSNSMTVDEIAKCLNISDFGDLRYQLTELVLDGVINENSGRYSI